MNPDVNPADFAYALAVAEAEAEAEQIIRTYVRWLREASRQAETTPNSHFYAALAVVLDCAIQTDRHNFAMLVTTMLSIDIAKAHVEFADWYATIPNSLRGQIDCVRMAMKEREIR